MEYVRRCRRAAIYFGLCGVLLGSVTTLRAGISVTNLVTDDPSANPGQITDPYLQNAWGIAHSAGSPFWVSDNGSGVATLYSINPTTDVVTKVILGAPPDPSGGVVIPPPGAGTPTGQVFNSGGSGAFNGDSFLFVSEDGTISGWRSALGTAAERLQIADPSNVYKGATLVTTGGHSYLLSANFHSGSIDVLKGDFGAPDLTGHFLDPNLPAGFAPFNIQLLGNRLYVTYALQDAAKHDDAPGPGHGFVNAFDLQGNLQGRIATMGTLDSPWGLTLAPSSFTGLTGDLLVGNFGNGTISVFSADPAAPGVVGQLTSPGGATLAIDGLWGLMPGNDGNGGSSQKIYFSAGPNEESHGVFGVLEAPPSTEPTPEPSLLIVGLTLAGFFAARWSWSRRRRSSMAS
jgi:uncharacterized protein (TIGR03118 family)